MDKQREEFEKSGYDMCSTKGGNWDVWQAAQSAMQPEIETLQVENKCLSDSCREVTIKYRDTKFHLSEAVKNYADIFNQLTAANQRIAELEERIRVADAEEPVGESTSGGEARIYSGIPLPRLGSKLYLHAQIPAEVTEWMSAKDNPPTVGGTYAVGGWRKDIDAFDWAFCGFFKRINGDEWYPIGKLLFDIEYWHQLPDAPVKEK